MVDFFSGLLGVEEDPLLAMLPPEQRAQLMARTRQQGIQNLGLQLLQAGGPTTVPGGIGSRLGGAIMGAQQSSQGMMDANLQRLLAARKLQQEQASQERRERVLSSISPEYRDLYDVSPSLFADVLKSRIIPGERKTAVVGNTLVDVATGQPVYQGQQERKTQTVGNQIVDVNTGEVVFTAPKDEKPPKTREVNVGNKILLINDETGQTIREFPVGLAPRAAPEASYTQQFDAEGRLFYIPNKPGTPVLDAQGRPTTEFVPAKVGATKKAEAARTESLNQTANTVLSKVDSALGKVSDWTSGYGGLLQYLPSTEARSLQADIKTIQANLGFAELAKMREQSPTGGALGQVAVKEIEFLQSTVASLDQFQDAASLRKALNEIRASYERWVSAVQGGQAQNTRSNVKLTPNEQNVLDKYK